jgi:POT family proton-dependent oligopeptide transporter
VPQRFAGQAMGLWYTTLALGNLLASRIAGDFDATNLATMPGQYLRLFWFGAIAAAVLLAAMPLLRRLTAPR